MYGVMIFSTNGNWVITAASTKPTEAPAAKPTSSSFSVISVCGAMKRKSLISPMKIRLGVGRIYCGTSNRRSSSSAPPMITTATSAIAATSSQVRMPGPLVSADQFERPTS